MFVLDFTLFALQTGSYLVAILDTRSFFVFFGSSYSITILYAGWFLACCHMELNACSSVLFKKKKKNTWICSVDPISVLNQSVSHTMFGKCMCPYVSDSVLLYFLMLQPHINHFQTEF